MRRTEKANLKDCPFCGFESVLESESVEGGMGANRWRARCSRECCFTKWVDGSTHVQGIGTINIELSVKQHLVYLWNSRKP